MKTQTNLHQKHEGHVGPLYALSEANENNFIFSGGSDKVVAKWNLNELVPENFSIKLQHTIYSIYYLKNKNQLWIGQAMGGIHVVDLESKKEIKLLQAHQKGVFDLIHNPGNNTIISSSADGTVAIWNADNFNLLAQFNLTKEKVRKCSVKNNLLAVALGNGNITIFDLLSIKKLNSFAAHEFSANAVAFHPTLPLLISGGKDAHLNIWEIENSIKKIDSIPAHNFAIYDIAFHPNLPVFATASRDKSIKLWNAENGLFLEKIERKMHLAHTHSVNKLLWSNYKNLLISTGDDAKIISWKINISDYEN
jgi:WD40 repeat protein